MTKLITATGRMVPCDSVLRGRQFPLLYIHTASLSYGEAGTLFEDPEETAVLTSVVEFAVPDDGSPAPKEERRVYRGYTQIYQIQRSPLYENPAELMIVMQQPAEEEDEG